MQYDTSPIGFININGILFKVNDWIGYVQRASVIGVLWPRCPIAPKASYALNDFIFGWATRNRDVRLGVVTIIAVEPLKLCPKINDCIYYYYSCANFKWSIILECEIVFSDGKMKGMRFIICSIWGREEDNSNGKEEEMESRSHWKLSKLQWNGKNAMDSLYVLVLSDGYCTQGRP